MALGLHTLPHLCLFSFPPPLLFFSGPLSSSFLQNFHFQLPVSSFRLSQFRLFQFPPLSLFHFSSNSLSLRLFVCSLLFWWGIHFFWCFGFGQQQSCNASHTLTNPRIEQNMYAKCLALTSSAQMPTTVSLIAQSARRINSSARSLNMFRVSVSNIHLKNYVSKYMSRYCFTQTSYQNFGKDSLCCVQLPSCQNLKAKECYDSRDQQAQDWNMVGSIPWRFFKNPTVVTCLTLNYHNQGIWTVNMHELSHELLQVAGGREVP